MTNLRFRIREAAMSKYLLTSLMVGCAAGQHHARMDPALPIQTEHGYTQNGAPIDPQSMRDTLEREEEAGPAAKRSSALATVSVVLSGLGGGLVGWPLGEKAAGSDPHWEFAYAGAGAIAVSIPLLIWSITSLSSAVDAHNRSLRQPVGSLDPASGPRRTGPAPLISW